MKTMYKVFAILMIAVSMFVIMPNNTSFAADTAGKGAQGAIDNISVSEPTAATAGLSGTIGKLLGCLQVASGLVAGINACLDIRGEKLEERSERIVFPKETVIGALANYISTPNKNFQPMNANFGILPEIEPRIKDKKLRYNALAQRSLSSLPLI